MITKIRRIVGWPFIVLSKIVVALAIIIGIIGSLIIRGVDETYERLDALRGALEGMRKFK